ncbi:MAG TPA: hypothetical protein VK453_22330 [Micromonosporaceae bacterium]|nr:hypothetical protein [Micromonosporaceae bacterium]
MAVVVGLSCVRVDAKYSALGAAFAFAWFLISFALYSYAWILRDNQEWLEAQRDR